MFVTTYGLIFSFLVIRCITESIRVFLPFIIIYYDIKQEFATNHSGYFIKSWRPFCWRHLMPFYGTSFVYFIYIYIYIILN